MTRASVQKRLRQIRDRLAKLTRAERYRHGRSLYWKARYRSSLRSRGEDHEQTRWLLHKFRTSRALGWKIDHAQAVLHRRAEAKLKWLRKHPAPLDPDGDGLILIDGKQVAKGVGFELLRIRGEGRWKGYVVSGFRTPEYSESLCINMCNAPSCPGLCAGRKTNHARKPPEWGPRAGAVDLTDYLTFASECRRLDSWLTNHLPRDLVHFSESGG